MADQNTDAEDKLKKLGERVREGWMQENPTTEKQLESVRDTIREDWEKERAEKNQLAVEPDLAKDKQLEREPEDPGLGRD